MNFTETMLALALVGTSAGTYAAPQPVTGTFAMNDPNGALLDDVDGILGFVDQDAMTFGVYSLQWFFGMTWTASGGTLLGPGTHTLSTLDPAPGVSGGDYTITVGAGQIGGQIDLTWSWDSTTISGVDVVMVWDVIDSGDGTITLASTDGDSDGIPGVAMIDGPWPGFSANFNLTTAVPETSTYGMMLAGLGLVSFMANAKRRRKG